MSHTPVVQAGSPRSTTGPGGRGIAPAPRGRVKTGVEGYKATVSVDPTPPKKSEQEVKMRQPTTKELAVAASKVQLSRDWKGTVKSNLKETFDMMSDDLKRVQLELLSFARLVMPMWAQPFIISMINGMHTLDALELRIQTFFDGLHLNPPSGFMDLLARLKHAARPIEQPVIEVPVAPEVKTFVAPGTGADYQPSTGITFRSLGRVRPIVGVV